MSDNRVVVFLWLKEKKIGSDWAIYYDQPIFKGQLTKKPVSYTHLTLPTILLV